MQKRQITLKNISELSNVSYRVVCEIMSGRLSGEKVRFSDSTRDNVLRIAMEHDYRPNRAARNLQNRRHNAIALYTGGSIYSIHDRLLNKLLESSRKKGIFSVIETISGSNVGIPISLSENAIDGAIIFADIPEIESRLDRSGLPLVYVNTNRRRDANCITYDENGSVNLALRYFKGNGKKRCGFIYSESPHYSEKERLESFLRKTELSVKHLKLTCNVDKETGRQTAIFEITKWLRLHSGLDCVILSADVLAPLFYHVAGILGKQIPDDIAVIAYNDLGVSRLIQPEVTSLAVNHDRLAELSFMMLYNMIEGKKTEGPISIPYQLIQRHSA